MVLGRTLYRHMQKGRAYNSWSSNIHMGCKRLPKQEALAGVTAGVEAAVLAAEDACRKAAVGKITMTRTADFSLRALRISTI